MNMRKFTKVVRVGLSGLLIGCLLAVSIIALASPVSAVVDPVVARDLPDTVTPGELFEVTVTFTATGNQFTAAFEDYAPAGWDVTANADWCTPSGGTANAVNNHFTITWMAAFDVDTQFTLLYKVTVPGAATPGTYTFTNGQLVYYIAGVGPYTVDIPDDSVVILPEYDLTLSSSVGGSVTTPGEGTFSYVAGTVVSLRATADAGYYFDAWTGEVADVDDVSDRRTTVTMNDNYAICANFTPPPPYLQVDKSVSPSNIGQKGSGFVPEESTVTLTVTGAGEAGEVPPLDVVFSLDASGSMAGDNMECAKDGAKAFIDKLDSARDQAGAVSWSSSIENSWALTNDFAALKANIDTITAGGGTNLEVGLAEAVDIMDAGKQTGSLRVIVFLSDGSGTYTGVATAEAVSKGYVIYAIGVGTGVAETYLRDMADQTGGSYYAALTAADIEAVFDDIAGEIMGVAGRDVVVTDVLQSYINLEDAFTKPPDTNTANADGTTTLQWELGIVGVGETWTVSFDVSSDRCGRVLANVVDESNVTYIDSEDNTAELLFPATYLNVRCAEEEVEVGVLPPEPAKIGASYLHISAEQIVPSQWVEVSANIYNRGGVKKSHTVALYINGYLAQSQTVGVSPGGTELVVFRVRADTEFLGGIYTGPGTYEVNVEGMVGQFFVLAPAAAAPTGFFGGPLGTGGIIAIVVVVIVLIVGLVFGLRRE